MGQPIDRLSDCFLMCGRTTASGRKCEPPCALKLTLARGRTKNLRAVQLLLGHSKLESTVRHLGIELDDTLENSKHTEVWAGAHH